jgi:hypothetical protein
MRPAPANAPAPRRKGRRGLIEHYDAELGCTGRARDDYMSAARKFLLHWPDPQCWADEPLSDRPAAGSYVRPFLLFLMLQGYLHPGYDYLVSRKLVNFWREAAAGPLRPDLERFCQGAQAIGYMTASSSSTVMTSPQHGEHPPGPRRLMKAPHSQRCTPTWRSSHSGHS